MAAWHEASPPPRSSLPAAKLQAFSSGRLREAISRAIPMELEGTPRSMPWFFSTIERQRKGAAFSEFRVSSDGGLQRHPSPPAVQGDG
nr:hypothetical protein Itr_chr01CG10410 [Ipomoea trifida]